MSATDELNNYCLSPAVRADVLEMVRRAGKTQRDLDAAGVMVRIHGKNSCRVVIEFADGEKIKAELTAAGWSVNEHPTPTKRAMALGERE